MKYNKLMIAALALAMLAVGCDTADDDKGGESVATPDILDAPYYFSFTTGTSVTEVPDVTLKYENRSYIVVLNTPASVSAAVRESGDFATATYTMGEDVPLFDTDTSYVIGKNWMDEDTYNPADHSISTNGAFYFVRAADYSIVKLSVESGSPSQFNLKVAVSADGSTFPTATDYTFDYAEGDSTDLNLVSGTVIETPGDWHIGLITAPVAGAPFPMQSVVVNYENGTRVGVVSGEAFDDIDSAPADLVWLTENSTTRSLAYEGSNEVMTYSGPPTHTVSIVDPTLVYIVDAGGSMYKFQLVNYDQPTHTVEFIYEAL